MKKKVIKVILYIIFFVFLVFWAVLLNVWDFRIMKYLDEMFSKFL